MRGLLDQDQQIASKLAPTGPLESISYFMFDKSAQRVAARMGFTGYLALSPQWQPLEVLHAWPLG